MIIGSALGRLFDGLTVDLVVDGNALTREVQYHYGDHKELLKWVLDRNNGNLKKYPLIWYVTAPYYEETDYKRTRSKLIILQSTQVEWFNDTRSVLSYDEIIEPTWLKVKDMLFRNPYISVLGDLPTKFIINDEPSYGLNTNDIRLGQNDFSNKATKGDESITLDVVDARVIEIDFRIKTNCI